MPTLNLTNQGAYSCHVCEQQMAKKFCSNCDEYFNVGHTSACSERNRRGEEGEHVRCERTPANGWHIPSRGHFTPGG